MTNYTVRLSDFASITGRSRDAIRGLQNTGSAPWDDDAFPEKGYRRYNGQHALALVIAEMLTAQGVNASDASEFVISQSGNIGRFLDEVEAGAGITPRFIAAIYVAEEDSFMGVRWTPTVYWGTGTADELQGAIIGAIDGVGREKTIRNGQSTIRQIGGPHVSVAPISEAYRLLRNRAEASGFIVDGRRIMRIKESEADT